MLRTRPFTVKVSACDAKPSPMAGLRKKVEASRNVVLKDNLNKLASIATADTKFLQELAQELDIKHKDWFEQQRKKQQRNKSDIVVVATDDDDDTESIFLEKR